eukprot:5242322-Amphidinium_carterae.1
MLHDAHRMNLIHHIDISMPATSTIQVANAKSTQLNSCPMLPASPSTLSSRSVHSMSRCGISASKLLEAAPQAPLCNFVPIKSKELILVVVWC